MINSTVFDFFRSALNEEPKKIFPILIGMRGKKYIKFQKSTIWRTL